MGSEKLIVQVNDTFRHEATTGTKLSMPGMLVATRRVQALPGAVKRAVLEQIRAYDNFDDGDDDFPDEHGRGQFSIGEQVFVWKIDWTADPTGIVISESEISTARTLKPGLAGRGGQWTGRSRPYRGTPAMNRSGRTLPAVRAR